MAEDKSKSLGDLLNNIDIVLGHLVDSDGFKKNMRKLIKSKSATNNPASRLPGKTKNNLMVFENSPDGSMDQRFVLY